MYKVKLSNAGKRKGIYRLIILIELVLCYIKKLLFHNPFPRV